MVWIMVDVAATVALLVIVVAERAPVASGGVHPFMEVL